jgi:hypothetical protein
MILLQGGCLTNTPSGLVGRWVVTAVAPAGGTQMHLANLWIVQLKHFTPCDMLLFSNSLTGQLCSPIGPLRMVSLVALLLYASIPLLLCSWQVQRSGYGYQGAGPGRAGRAWQEGAEPCCPNHAAAGQQLQ